MGMRPLDPPPGPSPSEHGVSGHPGPGPAPASDIWWPSLENCSNLFTAGFMPLPPTVLTSSGEAHTVSTSGWHASYWNALLFLKFRQKIEVCLHVLGIILRLVRLFHIYCLKKN